MTRGSNDTGSNDTGTNDTGIRSQKKPASLHAPLTLTRSLAEHPLNLCPGQYLGTFERGAFVGRKYLYPPWRSKPLPVYPTRNARPWRTPSGRPFRRCTPSSYRSCRGRCRSGVGRCTHWCRRKCRETRHCTLQQDIQ